MVFGAESTIKALREFGKFDDEAKGIKKALYKKLRSLVTEELIKPTRARIRAIPDTGPLHNWNSSQGALGEVRGFRSMQNNKSISARDARKWRRQTRSGGLPAWDSGDAAGLVGIDTRIKGKKSTDETVYVGKAFVTARSASGAAEVVEFAGRKTDNMLGRNLQAKYGGTGRLLWQTFDKNNVDAKIEPGVREALKEAEAGLQSVLDRITGSQP